MVAAVFNNKLNQSGYRCYAACNFFYLRLLVLHILRLFVKFIFSDNLGPREQLNQVTHWLDGSEIYGSSKSELDLLRDFSNAG
jgi:hypothetical protein